MTLYIQVDENNNPVNHPAYESNLKLVYPSHDFTSGSPNGWVEFERVPEPVLGVYELFDETVGAGDVSAAFSHNGLEYKFYPEENKFKDYWHVRDMTNTEKTALQNEVKAAWEAEEFARPSWIFNETKCCYEPPVPYPSDGNILLNLEYGWKESNTSWVAMPTDGKNYQWNFSSEIWEEVTE